MHRKGDLIQTFCGLPFWPMDPRSEEVEIVDIAHALSNQCRFTGHSRAFYSVAQHAYHVSNICNPDDALWGLLHDAAEAYVCDLARPMKHQPEYAHYCRDEQLVMAAICKRFGLAPTMPESVHRADEIMLASEVLSLMTPDRSVWGRWIDAVPPEWRIKVFPVGPGEAKELFMTRFKELTR